MEFIDGAAKKKRSFLSYFLLLIITGMFAVILMNTISSIRGFSLYSQYKNNHRISKLSYALVDQQAKLLAVMMQNNSSDKSLLNEIKTFSNNSFILDVSLYKSDGRIISQTTSSINLPKELISEQRSQSSIQIVKPITLSNQVLGFLRVTFNLKNANSNTYQSDKPLLSLYELYIIAFLSGIFYVATLIIFFSAQTTSIKSKKNSKKF